MPLDKPNKVTNDSISTPYTIINSDVAELGTTVATFYSGTTAQRPSVNVAIGDQFYNTQLKQLEIYTDNGWIAEGTPPQAPTNVTASNGFVVYGGTPSMSIRFVPATTGAPASSYTVTASPGGATATGISSPITITGLTTGTSYTFTVTATNTYGSATSSASGSISAATAPEAPTIGTATAASLNVSVPFTPGATGGSTPVYTIYSDPDNLSYTVVSSPATYPGLTVGRTYRFAVQAINSSGASPLSAYSNSVTPQIFRGSSSSYPATSASQIVADYPQAPNGLYWLNIGDGRGVQQYYVNTSYGNGPWVMVLNNMAGSYTGQNAMPGTVNLGTTAINPGSGTTLNTNFSGFSGVSELQHTGIMFDNNTGGYYGYVLYNSTARSSINTNYRTGLSNASNGSTGAQVAFTCTSQVFRNGTGQPEVIRYTNASAIIEVHYSGWSQANGTNHIMEFNSASRSGGSGGQVTLYGYSSHANVIMNANGASYLNTTSAGSIYIKI
jgi:hypothetical protein